MTPRHWFPRPPSPGGGNVPSVLQEGKARAAPLMPRGGRKGRGVMGGGVPGRDIEMGPRLVYLGTTGGLSGRVKRRRRTPMIRGIVGGNSCV